MTAERGGREPPVKKARRAPASCLPANAPREGGQGNGARGKGRGEARVRTAGDGQARLAERLPGLCPRTNKTMHSQLAAPNQPRPMPAQKRAPCGAPLTGGGRLSGCGAARPRRPRPVQATPRPSAPGPPCNYRPATSDQDSEPDWERLPAPGWKLHALKI